MDHEFQDAPPENRVQESLEDRPPAVLTQEDRQWAMFAHLSALAGLLVGGMGNFIGPLIIWLIKKDESRFVDEHGKESLNFQLNILIYSLILVAVSVATCGVALFVTGPLLGALMIYAIVMPIIAAIKANEGKPYEYPLTFRLIK
jgi:uncharacterized Tic20 family protein